MAPRVALDRASRLDGRLSIRGRCCARARPDRATRGSRQLSRLRGSGLQLHAFPGTFIPRPRMQVMNSPTARGLIAVDKMGGKVLFLDPVTHATTLVLDDFERVPHELLVVPQTATAYVPIYGDGIHGRN